MRLTGCALLIAAGILTGSAVARELMCKVKVLHSLLGALTRLRAELSVSLAPFPRLFADLATGTDAVARFFEALARDEDAPLAQRWQQQTGTALHMLPPESRAAMETLGAVLGCREVSRQLQALDACIAAQEACYRREYAQARAAGRLWQRICPCIAAAAALMLF